MPRRSSEYFLALAFLSIIFVLFTRGPSDVSEHVIPSSNAGGIPVLMVTDEADDREPNPIRQISVLGERNSGTRWTYE